MPIGPTFSGDLLQLVFNGIGIANIAMNQSVAPSTLLWFALHTAAPSSDTQSTSEAAYTSYTRVSVARSTASPAFTYTAASSAGAGAKLNPAATISFPAATSGTVAETETYISVGLSSAGAGKILWSAAMSPVIAVSNGVTPRLTTASTLTLA